MLFNAQFCRNMTIFYNEPFVKIVITYELSFLNSAWIKGFFLSLYTFEVDCIST